MTRKKVKLAFIENDNQRKACFRKRKKGLLKKTQELGTLCGVDVCMIIYSPFDYEPGTWPDTPSKLEEVISKFKELSEFDQCRKMMDQEGFLRQRIMKVHEQLKRANMDNKLKEIKCFLRHVLAEGKLPENLNVFDMNEIKWSIYFTLKQITQRTLILRHQNPPPPPPPPAQIAAIPTHVETSLALNHHVSQEPPRAFFPEMPLINEENNNNNNNNNQYFQTAAEAGNNMINADQEPSFDEFVWEDSAVLYSLLNGIDDQSPSLAFF